MIIDYARREIVTARPEDRVAHVVGLMNEHNVGCVVITRDDKPVGIVTDRDLALSLLAPGGGDPRTKVIENIMTPDPVAVREDLGFDRALEVMSEENIRRLLLVDDQGSLRGIVTFDDIFEAFCKDVRVLTDLLKKQQPVEKGSVSDGE